MDNEKIRCDNCGAVVFGYQAQPIFTGRHTKYFCPDCYRKGTARAQLRLMERTIRLHDKRQKGQ